MALNGFNALLLVPHVPEVLAKIKRAILALHFAPVISGRSFHTMQFKIRFTMTWLSHYIIFQIRKGNKLTG